MDMTMEPAIFWDVTTWCSVARYWPLRERTPTISSIDVRIQFTNIRPYLKTRDTPVQFSDSERGWIEQSVTILPTERGVYIPDHYLQDRWQDSTMLISSSGLCCIPFQYLFHYHIS